MKLRKLTAAFVCGFYSLLTFPALANTPRYSASLPHNIVDCVAHIRFEGMVKHVYSNDADRIDWVKVYPLLDETQGVWVEEYLAVPINGRLDTMFHGAYFVYPDNTVEMDWGRVARGLLEYDDALEIVDSWDASYCRKDFL